MKKIVTTLVLALGALSLTACGLRGGEALSDAQAQAVGDSIAGELEASTASLTAADVVGQGAAASVASQSAMVPPACVSFTPNPLVDSDADGVPDGASYTFNCTRTRLPGGTTTVTGQAQLSDPGAGFNLSVSNLKSEVRDAGGSLIYGATRNGTRSATGGGGQITLAHNLSVSRQVGSLPAASITNRLSLAFSAAGDAAIAQGQPLPSGTASVSGSYAWVRGNEGFSFTLSTPAALSYDSSCAADLKIVGGVLRATLAGGGAAGGAGGFVRITFNACGLRPSVLFIAGTV